MQNHLKVYWVLPIVTVLVVSLLFAGVAQYASALALSVSIKVAKQAITPGTAQKVTVTVTSDGKAVRGASVTAKVVDTSGVTKSFKGKTDEKGLWSFTWKISGKSKPGTFTVSANVSKKYYQAGSGNASFNVVPSTQPEYSAKTKCKGTALCITDSITQIIDGDTLIIAKTDVQLSLTITPKSNEPGFNEATAFTSKLCPVGSTATIDQDDKLTKDNFGRVLGKVSCSGKILNAELLYNGHAKILKEFCSKSEFASEDWAKTFGC